MHKFNRRDITYSKCEIISIIVMFIVSLLIFGLCIVEDRSDCLYRMKMMNSEGVYSPFHGCYIKMNDNFIYSRNIVGLIEKKGANND